MKFAAPKTDIAFREIFGDENRTEILISFINAALDFTEERAIKSLKLGNPYQLADIEILKDTILDVKATNERGEDFIVEMQVAHDKFFAQRSLYYSSKSYVSQIDVAEKYAELKKVYFLGILDF